MKTYKRLKNTNALRQMKEISELHAEMKNSYFWSPPSNASRRRRYEEARSNALEFRYNGQHYSIDQDTTCSCNHIYYRLTVLVDGDKKDIRAIRKLIKAHG